MNELQWKRKFLFRRNVSPGEFQPFSVIGSFLSRLVILYTSVAAVLLHSGQQRAPNYHRSLHGPARRDLTLDNRWLSVQNKLPVRLLPFPLVQSH